ncbi:hypothetical protein KIW84_035159 [Lathyrus oleraceus]|uniref:Uncharacterized protein n=1 Tax=Pisum sativum TaxID=3888 RepID=A0A9D4Y305_PEA|nr:hypothetical protein KIW84_035159 [Pisum sativum]
MPYGSDLSPDLIRFKGSHLPFSKEFPSEYRARSSQPSSGIMNMSNIFLLRTLMLQDSLYKDEEKWGKSLKDAHAKAKEIFVEKKYLQDSLDALLLRQKDLENDVSDLKDEVLSAAGVYFEWSKEQVLFLYPNLDLSPLDPFKAVKGGAIVDEESTTSLEPEFFPH